MCRGFYRVGSVWQRCPWSEPAVSDHPWVIVDFVGEPNLLLYGGLLYTGEEGDRISVAVEPNPLNPVDAEFVLRSPPNMTWRKEIVIREGAASGTGVWTIYTQDDRHEDRNGLYRGQLSGASLTFRKARALGVVQDVYRLDVSEARPGTRAIFIGSAVDVIQWRSTPPRGYERKGNNERGLGNRRWSPG